MSDKKIRFYGGALVVACIVLVSCGVFIESFTRPAKAVNGLEPILLLEFARTGTEIKSITNNFAPAAIYGLKKSLILDSIVIVPTYMLLLFFFAHKFRLRRAEYRRLFKILVFGCIGIAGTFDYLENYFSNVALNLSALEAIEWNSSSIFISAMVKWSLLSISALLLSFLFYRRDKGVYRIVALVLLLAGFMGFAAFYNNHLFNVFMILLVFVTLFLGIAFLFFPKKFVE